MTVQEASTTVDVPSGAFRRTAIAAWGVTWIRGHELLLSVRTAQSKYDGDILHIIKQYPGCDEERVLGILRARVPWLGQGTLLDKIFRPSLGTIRAVGRRLESAGKIKTRVDRSEDRRQLLRFYPNNPPWTNLATKMG
jgi:hypothetical protein